MRSPNRLTLHRGVLTAGGLWTHPRCSVQLAPTPVDAEEEPDAPRCQYAWCFGQADRTHSWSINPAVMPSPSSSPRPRAKGAAASSPSSASERTSRSATATARSMPATFGDPSGGKTRPASTSRHLIAEVRYQQAREQGQAMTDAPLLCTCGETLTSGAWDTHRLESNGPLKTAGRS